ncbi:SRP54-type protein [Hyaloraphidium curvatum]|nr:SRP54-type protein [Hyaloraphidium curvatum]
MLEQFVALTRTGIVLYSEPAASPKPDDPVALLLRDVLASAAAHPAGGSRPVFRAGGFEVKWRVDNELDVVFVAVYRAALGLDHVDELLDRAAKAFARQYGARVRDPAGLISDEDYDFADRFRKLRIEAEGDRARPRRGPQQGGASPSSPDAPAPDDEEVGDDDADADQRPLSAANAEHPEEEGLPAKRLSPRLAALRSGRGGVAPKGAKKGATPPAKQTGSDLDTAGSGKKKKAPRTWDGQAPKGEAAKALDYSGSEEGTVDAAKIEEQWIDKHSLGQRSRDGLYEAAEMEVAEADEDSGDDGGGKPAQASGGIVGFFKSLTGNRTLTEADLAPVMNQMREHLINKNVAAHIAAQVVDSVGAALVGNKVGTFKRVATVVREQTEQALQRILTPRTSTDLLRDIMAARKEGRPYSIVFCGVNGVGKSTNLAKVCFWLLQNGLKVLIAGCDTFRAGAVEQLKVHQRNLNALSRDGRVDLFERGYGKDAAGIAKDAIAFAKAGHFDVVLIDTAGRMQDNEPLMRALAKLVTTNNPDKIVFVGEALVGNEAVDQLSKFNRSLRDFSGVQDPREIDGMILTKFDTIDDKVGAAISMTYITGKPILFVGTGQTYTDLKKLSVHAVVATLLK